ncbi:MAG: hypothetical protein IJS01_03710 [Lentisphaeria bacterium]|nr:hypothetical protein [Lentisphaeria bacterium]
MGEQELFRARSRAAVTMFFIFFSLIALRALQLAVISRERFLRAGEKIALKRGLLAARRGRIMDKNKVPLVWSERHFELWTTLSPGADLTQNQRRTLQKIFPAETLPILPGNAAPLRFRLTEKEIEQIEPLIRRGFPLKIRSKTTRVTVDSPKVRTLAGVVRNGSGVSGWERQYDFRLRGRDGAYQVMLDRRRKWIDATWKMTRPPVAGEDVVLPIELEHAEETAKK